MTIDLPEKTHVHATGTSRRSFLQWSALLAGASALTACSATEPAKTSPDASAGTNSTIFRSANTPECLHCALLVHVEDDEVRKITADPDFHITACARGISRINQIHSPHRIKYPMRRTGERGEGKWERISWDEALDEISQNMLKVREESGNEAFLAIGGTGNWSQLSTGVNGLWSAFWNRFGGSTPLISQLCCASVTEGFNATFGGNRSAFRDEWIHSKYFIAWGNNPAVSNQGYFKNILEAREKNGARLITIDPRLSETAALSDAWIQVRPGTDAALALGMINVILQENLFDEEYVKAYTNAPFLVKLGDQGIDLESESATWTAGQPLPIELSDLQLLHDPAPEGDDEARPTFYVWDRETGRHVPAAADIDVELDGTFDIDGAKYQTVHSWMMAIAARYTPDVVEELTSAPAHQVETIAREFAHAKPAAIIQNMSGAQRTDNGTLTVISQNYLAALTGNVGVLGGGVNDTGGALAFAPFAPPVALQENEPIEGGIPVTQLGQHLLAKDPHEIRFFYIAGSGVLTQYPDTNTIIEAVKELDHFVVQDPFMTTTAKYADIVLPVCTIFEATNMIAGIRNYHVQLMEKAIEPKFESRSDQWILRELAKRLDLGEDFDVEPEEMIRRVLEPTGISFEDIQKGPVNTAPTPNIPFENKEFGTPSGRIEFFSTYLVDKGFEPMLEYRQPIEAPWVDKELAAKYPLQAINRRDHNTVNSSLYDNKFLKEIWTGQVAQMNPEDAKPRGIETGDTVKVRNDRGEITARAMVTPSILKGVVAINTGWGAFEEDQTASKLTPPKYERISGGHTLNSNMVEVEAQKGDLS